MFQTEKESLGMTVESTITNCEKNAQTANFSTLTTPGWMAKRKRKKNETTGEEQMCVNGILISTMSPFVRMIRLTASAWDVFMASHFDYSNNGEILRTINRPPATPSLRPIATMSSSGVISILRWLSCAYDSARLCLLFEMVCFDLLLFLFVLLLQLFFFVRLSVSFRAEGTKWQLIDFNYCISK